MALQPRPDPIVAPGTRLALSGRAGSGKTTLAKWFVLRSPLRWVVLDTKHDSGFRAWKPIAGFPSLSRLAQRWAEQKVVVVRPKPHELTPAWLDYFINDLHEGFDNFGLYVDELYHVVRPGAWPGTGLTGLVTRGRDRRQSFIGGAQRPAFVPGFIYSEANAFAVLDLTLPKDRERIYEYTGREEAFNLLAPRHWLYFDVAARTCTRYGPVSIK